MSCLILNLCFLPAMSLTHFRLPEGYKGFYHKPEDIKESTFLVMLYENFQILLRLLKFPGITADPIKTGYLP